MTTQYLTAFTGDGFIGNQDELLDMLFTIFNVNHYWADFLSGFRGIVMDASIYERVAFRLKAMERVTGLGSGSPYSLPVWVLTSGMCSANEDSNVRYANDEVSTVHREIATVAGHKNVWILGGAELAGQFYDAGLLDELIVYSGAVGQAPGEPLFPNRVVQPPLRLTAVNKMGAGVNELRYQFSYPQMV